MIDKQDMIKRIISDLELNCDRMAMAAQRQTESTQKQEGRMQSRYDTMRIEGSWLSDGLRFRQVELQRELDRARRFTITSSSSQIVVEGSLVQVEDLDGAARLFFILPFAGGHELQLNDCAVIVITPNAPIAQVLIGRRKGDWLTYQKLSYRITQID